uniref:Reverse transcriptase domain-containing protein n=1 Tax=Tanacetum cinerariifolium TaxID=118510 RepID=A0A6L2MCV0_TANCI|nr:hypothetical protein [Tanacetum cinerariifolium]
MRGGYAVTFLEFLHLLVSMSNFSVSCSTSRILPLGDEGPSSRGRHLSSLRSLLPSTNSLHKFTLIFGAIRGTRHTNLPEFDKKGKNMTDSQSPEGGARRVLPEFRVTGPQLWFVASFLPDNGYPSPTLVNQIENTSRTINIKPNKKPRLKKKPYSSPLPEQIFALETQQMSQIQKRRSKKQNFSVNHEGKHKSINGKRPKQAELVWLETIIGMIRGNTSRKRPREQSKQWLDNEISFPSTPWCQLVDCPIILETLIEGFMSEGTMLTEEVCPKLYCNNDNKERNSPRMLKDGRSTRTKQERRITLPKTQASGFVGMTSQGKKEGRWQADKAREPDDTIQPPPSPPNKDT